ncbi:hypothetical protein HU200_030200 [Digitaria exilis]|uniref:Transcription factor CBF/NF-Y/archaeal histone domain-containing protein n=1 Tax=Digitaria exilis TaxID=1010633 RepID=A0A835ERA6_9POAL|nr:hypothetical protein HU200_030200 [Digitaria exilis]
MAGKKTTPVKPAPPSTQRNGSATPGSKGRPKKASEEASAASAKAPKSPKITKEKPAPAKEGGKRKKQQAPGDAAAPAKKRRKGDGPGPKPQKEPKPAKKEQPSGKPEKPATPAKKQQPSGKPGKPATPSKKQQSSSKPEKPATPAKKQRSPGKPKKATPTKQHSPGKTRKSPAPATTPTKKKQAKPEMPMPTKKKRGDDEPQKEPRSPKRASGDGEAPASTPVKKKRKDQKAAAADMGACSFPMARVRQLMRAEDDTIRPSNEAVFLINKASELFLGKFAEDAYHNALKERKKSIIYDNLCKLVLPTNLLFSFLKRQLKVQCVYIKQRVEEYSKHPNSTQKTSDWRNTNCLLT